ncbi:hypothetical protein EV363DRAFT_1166248, partial [Boletus edulis]
RYVNMNYLFFLVLCDASFDQTFISYDIACQWSKNLWSHIKNLPSDKHVQNTRQYITFVVPSSRSTVYTISMIAN